MTHKAAIIKSLLDQAFCVLQHDSDEDQPEYAHLRDALGKSFWKVLKNVPIAQPAQTAQSGEPVAKEHRPGCEALGGYGHGVGPCDCGADAVIAAQPANGRRDQ